MRLPKPPFAPDWMYNLMKLCWKTEPEKRPNFPTLYSILGTIFRDGGKFNPSLPQNYIEYSIAETQLHSNGNNSNEMRLPGLYATDMTAVFLPPPPQFNSPDSVNGLGMSRDPTNQQDFTPIEKQLVVSFGESDGYRGSITRSTSMGRETASPNVSTDSCLPDSPFPMPPNATDLYN